MQISVHNVKTRPLRLLRLLRLLCPLVLSVALAFFCATSGQIFSIDNGQVNLQASTQAYAITAQEAQVQADAEAARLAAELEELEKVTATYTKAIEELDSAHHEVNLAAGDEAQAVQNIARYEAQLGECAVSTYKFSDMSFIDVIFNATSFSDFINGLVMANTINENVSDLISKTKIEKTKASEAKKKWQAQAAVAQAKAAEVDSLKNDLESKVEQLQASVDDLNSQVELLAAIELAQKIDIIEGGGGGGGYLDIVPASIVDKLPSFINPCPAGSLTSGFGYRSFDNAVHKGVDLACGTGSEIYAAASGQVSIAGWGGSAGNWVNIAHGGGVVTKYMHASELLVNAGDYVNQGDLIALVGNTGNSYGSHLHFQLEVGGLAINPMPYI